MRAHMRAASGLNPHLTHMRAAPGLNQHRTFMRSGASLSCSFFCLPAVTTPPDTTFILCIHHHNIIIISCTEAVDATFILWILHLHYADYILLFLSRRGYYFCPPPRKGGTLCGSNFFKIYINN